jgi:hypothetical protein
MSKWTPDVWIPWPHLAGHHTSLATNGKPHCRFLPLLPPITQNVKLPDGVKWLEFKVYGEEHSRHTAKNGKNGNLQCRGQHCRPDHLSPTRGPARVCYPRWIVT